ncbi:MAG: protein translocase subunit SecD [Myxococcota bacterium]|nr:protein translocase subunit SecD [Myxococcota bacterium]
MSLRWRAISVGLLVVVFSWLTASNFVPKERRLESDFLPDNLLRMGLDLQGGIHWVVGVDLDKAVEREISTLATGLRTRLADDEIFGVEVTAEGSRLRIDAVTPQAQEGLDRVLRDYSALQQVGSEDGSREFELVSGRIDELYELTMKQVLEVLRRRIDDPVTGIPESVVARQGSDRVLVQIPGGLLDRDRAIMLLQSTAFLEFKIVEDSAETEELLLARYPDGIGSDREIVAGRDPDTDSVIRAYLVAGEAPVTGQHLTDARVSFDNRQRPEVSFTFDNEGGRRFGELTETHIGEPLAIILDDRVYSAPAINSRTTFNGRITGQFSAEEAADLAVVLRAGSLAVPVEILEERTVGPALGQDSVDRGLRASVVGLALIVAFAVGYYRLSGGYASIALAANLVLLIGLMSLFEATLTLPGIAGLVLTIGMAVDANVIIFERIREELRERRVVRTAIAAGFNKAFRTVLDANITTLITGIVLLQFGTGPIKGFAVTLCVGILTSVFSALVITRLLFHLYPGERAKALSI